VLEQRFPNAADFYRSRLRRYWMIRVPKEAIWTAVWFTRWRILRPIVRAIIPTFLLRYVHVLRTQGLVAIWRRWLAPDVQLLTLTVTATSQAGKVEILSPPEWVYTPPPEAYPEESGSVLPHVRKAYEFPSIMVAEVFDAEVSGLTNLVRLKGVTVHHDLYRFLFDFTSEELHGKIRIDPLKNTVKHYHRPKIRHSLAVGAVFTDACSPNYAHWLTEVLPRINLFCRTNSDPTIPLIVDAGLHANLEESLRAVAGDKAEIISLGTDDAARVKRLLITTPAGYIPFERRGPAKFGHSHGIFSPYAFASMRNHLGTVLQQPEQALPRRVLLRRNSPIRAMRNEPQLEEKLASLGFSVIQPECLSFAEQYHLFANAEVIVGATGAGLANLVFCSKLARVVICISTHPEHSYSYWQNMAAALGNKVSYAFGPTVGPGAHGLHADFCVDVDAVVRAIEQ